MEHPQRVGPRLGHDAGTGPLHQCPCLSELITDGAGVVERLRRVGGGLAITAGDHVQLRQRPRRDAAQSTVVEHRPQGLQIGDASERGRLVGVLVMQPSQEPQRVDPLGRFDRDLDPPHGSRECLVEEVETPGRFCRDGQQLRIVRCLGKTFVGETQGGERQTLLEVLGSTAPRDCRDLVVALRSARVVCERGVVHVRRLAQDLEAALVQATTLAAEQLVDDRIGNERVREPELVVSDLDQHSRRGQRPQGRQEVRFLCLGHDEQSLERSRSAVDRERLDDTPVAFVEPVQLLAHRFFQRPRQLGVEHLRHQGSRTDDPHQLLDDERNTGRPAVQRLDERRGRLGVGGRRDRGDHRANLGTIEPVEPDLLDRMAALEAQHELAARLPSRELVGPIRGDDEQARPRLLGKAVDEVGAGRVDPVQIFDHEQCRPTGGGRRDQFEDGPGDIVT